MKITKGNTKQITEICKGKAEILGFENYPKNDKTDKITVVGATIKIDDKTVLVEFERKDDIDAFEKIMSNMAKDLMVVEKVQMHMETLFKVLNLANIDNSFICSRRFINSIAKAGLCNIINHEIKNGKNFYSCEEETDDKIKNYNEENNRYNKLFFLEIKKVCGYYVVTKINYGNKICTYHETPYPITQVDVPEWVDYVLVTRPKYELYSLKKNNMEYFFSEKCQVSEDRACLVVDEKKVY